ncbi:reverse transcriptase family protein [Vibrio parahaemolyticus]|uniref:reverse transcriptase family protein n=1 Tax=Vibrio parahaemolyticus TaxID=670 RepID=UPI0003591E4F|nr:reverse transcriptase family protein [Vibrio parahaemolyticus]AGR00222.1 hypothetical protein M636_17340 [Vibrio parahaemolyticus O1:K33 str. CDC_K4557]ODY85179.1 RNA-dependent DNA polymerase [Vibrio parahaemolyticus]HCG8847479.1 RNA-directed DNA polymerase [Vibrio parahaemolyticus]
MTIVSSQPYFSQGIIKGRNPQKLNALMSKARKMQAQGLPYIHSLHHLALLTNTTVDYLNTIVCRAYDDYTSYRIQKRSGGSRFINAPSDELKLLQRWINNNILYNVPSHWCCFSYHKNASIIDCAQRHCQSKWLIKLDIENFFDTINEVQVYETFHSLGYKPMIAFFLARICTYEPNWISTDKKYWVSYNTNSDELPYSKKNIKYFGRVPQGAPTSPIISNMVMFSLDDEISNLIQNKGGIYTRYSDDIFVSFSQPNFNRNDVSKVIGKIFQKSKRYGYKINKTKIKVLPPGSKKIILGLNVNQRKPELTKEYKNRIESHLYGMSKFGISNHAQHRKFDSIFSMIEHIKGLINYARQISPKYGTSKYTELSDILMKEGLS